MPENPSNFRPADAAAHAWSQFAACSVDPQVNMYPSDADAYGIELAKSVCDVCPVRPECLTEAVRNGEAYGVWGGLMPEERTSMRRRVTRNNHRVVTEGVGEMLSLDDEIEATACQLDEAASLMDVA